jgi:hypothetical protein
MAIMNPETGRPEQPASVNLAPILKAAAEEATIPSSKKKMMGPAQTQVAAATKMSPTQEKMQTNASKKKSNGSS